MSKRKSRATSKPRIVARVAPEFHVQVSKFAAAMKVNIQEFVVQALVTEMEGFDLRVELKKLQNQFDALQKNKSFVVSERKRLQKELKEIASKLGVPDTAGHCVQRITEIEQELQMTADKLSIVEGDRDTLQTHCNDYKASRDAFKAKAEECEADLRVVKAKLEGYQQQGFWERVFGRVPAVVPYAEPK